MTSPAAWWNSRAFALTAVLLCTVPLLWPSVPPLTDLPTHMARYRVALDLDSSPYLRQYYDFHWALFGNLGLELIVVPLARIIALEPAVKLVVIAIPAATAAGMLFLAREVHGNVPPTSLFALPLAYSHPFQLGFVNFTLAVALLFWAAGLWLHLGRRGRPGLRAALFVPIAFIVWISHSVAWGMLGLVFFGLELAGRRESGLSWARAARGAAIACLPLCPPALLTAEWWTLRSGGTSGTWSALHKVWHTLTILKNGAERFDLLSALLLYLILLLAKGRIGLAFERRLAASALLLFLAFLAMPFVMMGSSYADMRVVPYAVAVGVIAVRPLGLSAARRQAIALAGLLFLIGRLGMQTHGYLALEAQHRAQLAALDRLPRGARVFALANSPCMASWDSPRMDHIASMGVVRREAFVNGQWPMPGGRLLSIRYAPAEGFALSPTQQLQPEQCRVPESYSIAEAVERLPRSAFDYLWLIDVDPGEWPRDPGLVPVWRSSRGVLFRIAPPRRSSGG